MATELSDGAKIIALADAFDAMTTDRPYRGKLGLREALRAVMKGSGTQFDEKILNTFFNVLRKELNGEVKEPQILPHLHHMDVGGFKSTTASNLHQQVIRPQFSLKTQGGDFSPPCLLCQET
jgi:hypothetical protein